MAIDRNKPQPLTINGNPHFTLSDYEPGDVTVTRPRLTDSDFAFELQRMLFPHGMEEKDLSDEWVSANTPFKTVDEFKKGVKANMENSAAMAVEREKNDLILANMAKKLEQSVPQEMIDQMKRNITLGLEQDAQRLGMDTASLKAATGLTDAQIEEMALQNAKSKAALLAYVDEKKIKVEESDLASIFGNKEATDTLIAEAKKHNELSNLLRDAAATKAHQELANEARITYEIETLEAANTRAKEYEKILHEMHEQLVSQKAAEAAEAAAEQQATENAQKATKNEEDAN